MFICSVCALYSIKKKQKSIDDMSDSTNSLDTSDKSQQLDILDNHSTFIQLNTSNIIDQSTKLVSFLPPPLEIPIYEYRGTIDRLEQKIKDNSIYFVEPIVKYIYICNWKNLHFEIRLTKHTRLYKVEFKLVIGSRTELLNLIKCLIS